MTNSMKHVEKVADIIKVLKGGISFYQEALEKVQSHDVKTVFGRMLLANQEAIEILQPFVLAEQVELDTSFAVEAREMYAKLISTLSFDSNHTFVDQLEEVEDNTIAVIKEALKQEQSAACNNALLTVLAFAQDSHHQMKKLHEATAQ